MTSFTSRCLANWLPLATEIRKRGGECEFILFPRVADPDHSHLLDIENHAVFCEPIDENFTFTKTTEDAALERVSTLSSDYDAILMTSCVAGPELKIRAAFRGHPARPIIVGLQHGFFQLWNLYEANSSCFDYFGVFGDAFIEQFGQAFRPKAIPLGLPKLDEVVLSPPSTNNRGLFVLQSSVSPEGIEAIVHGMAEKGCEISLRPHPEHRTIYDQLRTRGMKFSNPEVPFQVQAGDFDFVITSGSTAALESLEAKIPTVVIPSQHGNVYQEFGIVSKDMSADGICQVLTSYNHPDFWQLIDARMREYTGPRGARANFAYEQITHLLSQRKSHLWEM